MTACSAAVTSTSSHTPTATGGARVARRDRLDELGVRLHRERREARDGARAPLRLELQPGDLAGHGIVDDGVDLAGAAVEVLRRPERRAAVLDRGRALVEQLEVVRASAEGLGQVTLGSGAGGLRSARRSGKREGTKDQESGERNRVRAQAPSIPVVASDVVVDLGHPSSVRVTAYDSV